jgi:hypothetical protein
MLHILEAAFQDMLPILESHVDLRTASGVVRAHPDRPALIVTRDELRLTDAYALVPAHLLLWALG